MAHFAYISGRGSLANWGTLTTVAPSEFWWFEESIFKCINGDEGGTWNPSTVINIGGAGLSIYGSGLTVENGIPFRALGTATFYNSVAFSTATGTFTCAKAAAFSAAVVCDSTLRTNGALSAYANVHTYLGFYTHQNATIGDDNTDYLTVNAASEFQADVSLNNGTVTVESTASLVCDGPTTTNGTLTANGALNANGNVALGNSSADAVVCNGAMSMGAAGTIGLNYTSVTMTSDGDFSSEGSQILRVNGLSGANRSLTSEANPRAGVLKWIKNEDLSNDLTIKNFGGSPLTVLSASHAALIFSDGTNWHTIMVGTTGGY
jgi:hypothetical protein